MFSYNGGCLPPQLPPLPPPPPPHFYNPMLQPPQWLPNYPPPPSFTIPPPQLPPQFLPSPSYSSNFAQAKGRGTGGRHVFTSRKKPKWIIQKCEPCDRVYKTEETFAEHLQSHVKCSQCDFTALPKKVKEHGQVHSLPEFLSFTSVDDIKRWRDERKKNYPTASNVAKKIKSEEQRKSRGQTIDTPLYRYVNQLIGDYDSHSRGRGRGRRRGNHRGRWNTQRHYTNQSDYTKFDNNEQTVSDTDNTNTPTTDNKQFQSSNGAVTNSLTINEEPKNTNRGRRNRDTKRRHPSRGNNSVKKAKDCNWMTLPIPNRPTLLEKLLATNIKSEQNAILQCVRYTVQNNFFQNTTSKKNDDRHQITVLESINASNVTE